MFLKSRRWPWGVVGGAVLLAVAAARADDVDPADVAVPLGKVPKAIMEVVKQRLPKGTPQSAVKHMEEGSVFFNVEVKSENHEYHLFIAPDGALQSISKVIEPKELPEKALQAVLKKYPKSVITSAGEVAEVDDDGKEKPPYYDLEVTKADKGVVLIEIELGGKILSAEDVPAEEVEKTEPADPGEKTPPKKQAEKK